MKAMNKQAKLSTRVRQDLAERSKQGLWAQPLCMTVVLMTTGLLHRAPMLVGLIVLSTILQAVLRWAVLRCLALSDRQEQPHWHRVHVGLLLSCAATWGAVSGLALYQFGYADRDVLMLLLYHALITFGMVHLLVHDRRCIVVALCLLLIPVVLGELLSGTNTSVSYLLAPAILFTYNFAQGSKLNRLYEQQISDNYELSVAAYQDSLTGLPNRLFMNEAIETSMEQAQTQRSKIALLYIDLDGFKQINDTHSHKIGDLFLCEAATRIASCLRHEDIAARVGGDEFTVLLPECTSEEEAVSIAERVLHSARTPVVIDGHALRYSTSIGVSLFPDRALTADHLVRSADEAMYTAKTSGKDRVCIATDRAVIQVLERSAPRSLAVNTADLCLNFV